MGIGSGTLVVSGSLTVGVVAAGDEAVVIVGVEPIVEGELLDGVG
jgi:hypothetical protein